MPKTITGRKTTTGFTLDSSVVAAIDREKGAMSRSAFLNDLLWFTFVATPEEQARVESYGTA
jgi:hypothetical protein